MKTSIKTLLSITFVAMVMSASAQSSEPTTLIRLYEDNDFFNLSGHGTDFSYSAGTRLDIFYKREGRPRGLNRLMPRLKNSNTVYGWSLMQMIYTPINLSKSELQSQDYMYSGALFVNHSLYSYNAEKRQGLQTEFIAGVRGPRSFAQQTQSAVHKVIHDVIPQGWNDQLDDQVLLNVNVTYERQLWALSNFLEVNAGTQVKAGSMMDAVSVYPMVRLGKMSPYFDSYLNQFTSFQKGKKRVKTQYYLVFRPTASVVMYNAMVEGHTIPVNAQNPASRFHPNNMEHHVLDFQFGAVVVLNKFGISYMQTTSATYIEGSVTHVVGNLSLYYSW